jgi:hypothetical protein
VRVHSFEVPHGLLVEMGEFCLHPPHAVLPGAGGYALLADLRRLLAPEPAGQPLHLGHALPHPTQDGVDLGHQRLLPLRRGGPRQPLDDAQLLQLHHAVADQQEGLVVVADRVPRKLTPENLAG